MNAKSSFIVASAIAVVLTSTRLQAQSGPPGEYGYKFVPNTPNSQWGGEIWFTVPSEANGLNGAINETDYQSSFILTPDGPMNLGNEGGFPWAVSPVLPQYPFPYTPGGVRLAYENWNNNEYDGSLFGTATWTQTAITSMDLTGGGVADWHAIDVNRDSTSSPFQDQSVYGVVDFFNWEVTSNSITESSSYSPLSLLGAINDPGETVSVQGTWVAIPDCANSLPLLGLTALCLFGASKQNHSRARRRAHSSSPRLGDRRPYFRAG
jgi:hypothetical protein